MSRQQIRKSLSDTPQNFGPGNLLRGFLSEHTAATRNEDALPSGAERSSCYGGVEAISKCNLDHCVADVHASSTDSVWRNITGQSSPRKFSSHIGAEKKLEAALSSEEIVLRERVRSTGELKAIASPENNILLCILNQLRVKCSSLLEDDRRALGCSCSDTAGTAGTLDTVSKPHDPSIGIFLRAPLIESSNLAHSLITGKRKEAARKQSTLGFARLQGELQIFGSNSLHPDMRSDSFILEATESHTSSKPKRDPFTLFQETSVTSFRKMSQELQILQPRHAYPDMLSLNSMRDFLRYTETKGRKLFEELDRDKDGQVTLDDLKVAMNKMKLPPSYAKKFLGRTQTRWLATSCGWLEFSSVIQEKEPTMLRLFNSLNVSEAGTLQRTNVKDLLKNAGLPSTDTNAIAMMNCLGVDREGSIKYGHFRKFMLLIPREQLAGDPWRIWFKAATLGPDTSNREMLGSILSQFALISRELMNNSETRKKLGNGFD